VIIELVKEHLFGNKDFQTVEYLVLRTDEFRLNRAKTTLSVERNSIFDFEVSDEVQGLDMPYLYFLCNNELKVVSLMTSNLIPYSFRSSGEDGGFPAGDEATDSKAAQIRQNINGPLPGGLPHILCN